VDKGPKLPYWERLSSPSADDITHSHSEILSFAFYNIIATWCLPDPHYEKCSISRWRRSRCGLDLLHRSFNHFKA